MKQKKVEVSRKGKFRKEVAFKIILFIIPFLLLIFFELALRLGGYGYNLSLFIKSDDYKGYYRINPDVSKRYFNTFKGTSPTNDIFLIEKPDTVYRVFVMGCSTTAGFPYENVSFPRILFYRLQDAFPDKKIELVNTAMSAINSYTQVDFIDEILEQKPDAILIYTGHNEFYGAMGVGSAENTGNKMWMKRLHLKLIKFRTYQLVKNLMQKVGFVFKDDFKKASGTLMERIVKDKSIVHGSDTYKDAIAQFTENMDIVIKKAKKAGVPVIISDLVSNIKDNKPFKSIKVAGSKSADDYFELAKKYEGGGNFDKAREAYYMAKDLDGIPFRAPEDINKAIEQLANTNQVLFFSMKKIFENASPNGLVGNNLIIEHLHPNVDGYFLMADAFFNMLKTNNFISTHWDTSNIRTNDYYRYNWGFTELDSLAAQLGIGKLKAGWPFKPENIVNNFYADYKPVSYIDSIALMVERYENITLADEHLKLAKRYQSSGDYFHAFKEYQSLTRYSPYNIKYYIDALPILQNLDNHQLKIDFLKSYPNHKEYFIFCMNIAQEYAKMELNENALKYCMYAKKVFKKETDNKIYLLSTLYKIYENLGDKKNAIYVLAELREIDPTFNTKSAKKDAVVIVVDKNVKEYINKAIAYAKQGKFNDALRELNESLKIKETAIAYQIIGSIYYQLKDDRCLYNLERSYELNPTDENTLNNLFLLSLQSKNIQKSRKYLEELKRVSKDESRIERFNKMYKKTYDIKG